MYKSIVYYIILCYIHPLQDCSRVVSSMGKPVGPRVNQPCRERYTHAQTRITGIQHGTAVAIWCHGAYHNMPVQSRAAKGGWLAVWSDGNRTGFFCLFPRCVFLPQKNCIYTDAIYTVSVFIQWFDSVLVPTACPPPPLL